jgi:hypothetical protein
MLGKIVMTLLAFSSAALAQQQQCQLECTLVKQSGEARVLKSCYALDAEQCALVAKANTGGQQACRGYLTTNCINDRWEITRPLQLASSFDLRLFRGWAGPEIGGEIAQQRIWRALAKFSSTAGRWLGEHPFGLDEKTHAHRMARLIAEPESHCLCR